MWETLLLSSFQRWGDTEALRDHRVRGGRTQVCPNPECGIWSHLTNEKTEVRRSKATWVRAPAFQWWARSRIKIGLLEQSSLHGASPRGEESVGLLCFESKLSSVWMNKHLLDPYCVSRTFIFNQKPGWYQCDKAWFWEFCIKQQEKLNTFCCVFVPKRWWYLYFLAIKFFSKETKYLLKSQWMSFSTWKSFQNPSYMRTPVILNFRTFISLHYFPVETFGSFQLPEGWSTGL